VKFSLHWLDDFVDVAKAGGAAGVRALLDQAGIPVESVARSGSDEILDAEITPNRPDAMGHRGLAREVAAMSGIAPRTRATATRSRRRAARRPSISPRS
jgi:phenylalanyl-tRNA synthetase beta chain